MLNLNNFIFEKILSKKKNVTCILGHEKNTLDKIILLFSYSEDYNYTELINNSEINDIIKNDRFFKFLLKSNKNSNFLVEMINPANQKDIDKYSESKKILFTETYDYYMLKVIPKIIKYERIESQLNWINNIIEGKSEQEKIIYSNEDFLLLPNINWDEKDINSLYYLAISKDKYLTNLRDLTSKNIEALEKILKEGKEVISKKHNLPENQILCFIHYYPSFYHFHIHFVNIKNDIYENGIGRNHYLPSVINNLKLIPDYYQKVDIEMIISENHSNLI